MSAKTPRKRGAQPPEQSPPSGIGQINELRAYLIDGPGGPDEGGFPAFPPGPFLGLKLPKPESKSVVRREERGAFILGLYCCDNLSLPEIADMLNAEKTYGRGWNADRIRKEVKRYCERHGVEPPTRK